MAGSGKPQKKLVAVKMQAGGLKDSLVALGQQYVTAVDMNYRQLPRPLTIK